MLGVLIAPAAVLHAQDAELRIFEQDPYDQITLRDESVLKTLPLELEGRRLPENPRGSDALQVRLLDEPTELYELRWRDIAEVTLFEEMVLAEANALVDAGKFDEAYDYFAYLLRNHASFPGVEESAARYLYEEAKHWQREGIYDRALAVLLELYERMPDFDGLDRALGAATSKLIERELEKEEYAAARHLLENLAEKFPNTDAVVRWSELLSAEAATLVEEARSHLVSGRIAEAHQRCQAALRVWPALPEARQTHLELTRDYPYIVVGVSQKYGSGSGRMLDDWAHRRVARLLNRPLLELNGYGEEGGQYQSPLGELQRGDLGRQLTFQLRRGIRWLPGETPLTGYDIARHLLAMADPDSPAFEPQWAELFGGVSVHGVYTVDVRLSRTHVRPDALLQTDMAPWNLIHRRRESSPPTIGSYGIEAESDDEIRFRANEGYFALGSTQPRIVIERRFETSSDAIRALRWGEISVLERVNPWEVAKVRALDGVAVEPYAVPTLHCLIPDLSKPLTANRQFRRALAYGIHRQSILDAELLGRSAAGEGRVISGPFPVGYAYNDLVPPRPFEPNLARMLSRIAQSMLARASAEGEAAEGEDDGASEPPTLVLAHPDNEIARVACQEIERQLEQVLAVQIELAVIEPAALQQEPSPYDLVYAELAMWEPVVDARRLLGSDGLVGGSSAFLDQALRQLEEANDWRSAREKLLEIHKIADDDAAIIPLWQLTDYFAYHTNVSGIGSRPVQLYQNIERWQVAPLVEGPIAVSDTRSAGGTP